MIIKITHLFPDLLNMYGDSGNIECLRHRLLWRGIDVEVVEHTRAMGKPDLTDTDILFIGGGGDKEERTAVELLREYKDDIKEYIDKNRTFVAVCGGFPMLGEYYAEGSEMIEGAGILEIFTEPSEKRITGDIIINSDLIDSTVVGFTNHGGKTYIKSYAPLGEVIHGTGNNGEDAGEGIQYKNVFATYIHGPLFPKNPKLCDCILERTLAVKYKDFAELSPLNDELEEKAHNFILDRYVK